MRVMLASLRRLRPGLSALSTVVEVCGMGAIVYGVSRVNVPAAWIVAGVLAVLVAVAVDRGTA